MNYDKAQLRSIVALLSRSPSTIRAVAHAAEGLKCHAAAIVAASRRLDTVALQQLSLAQAHVAEAREADPELLEAIERLYRGN